MSGKTHPRVVVLEGGMSAEREVSLVSGRECARALRQAGHDVTQIDAGGILDIAMAGASATLSTSAFQAPQLGHLPSQRGLLAPQVLQV